MKLLEVYVFNEQQDSLEIVEGLSGSEGEGDFRVSLRFNYSLRVLGLENSADVEKLEDHFFVRVILNDQVLSSPLLNSLLGENEQTLRYPRSHSFRSSEYFDDFRVSPNTAHFEALVRDEIWNLRLESDLHQKGFVRRQLSLGGTDHYGVVLEFVLGNLSNREIHIYL